MATIQDLEERINAIEDALTEIAKNNAIRTDIIDTTAIKVDGLTPYTETKTAYISDTLVVFTNVPSGNLTVYFDKPYTVEREADRVTVKFEPLEEVSTITISII